MREASSSQLAGLWTAACDAGIDRIPAIFGLPSDLSFFLFHQYHLQREETSQSLTLAPRCSVRRCLVLARVVRPPREMAGKFRLTVRELPSPYRHPLGQLPSPDKVCLPHADTIGKAFGGFGVPVESSTSLYSRAPDLVSPEMSYSSLIILLP